MVRGGHFRGQTDDAGAGARNDRAPTVGRRNWRQRVLLGLGMACVTGCLVGAGGVFYVLRSYQGIQRYEDLDVDQVAAGEA